MSDPIYRGPIEGVINLATGKLLSVSPAGGPSNGSRDVALPQLDAGVQAQSGLGASGFVLDAAAITAQGGRRQTAKGANVFWDFRENAGATCNDLFANTPLTLVGSGVFWGVTGGLFLSKTPVLAAQVATTAPQAMLRRIFDLSRITPDHALTVYGVMQHPAPYAGSNNSVMCWGLMSDNTAGARSGGWSLKLRDEGLLTFSYLAPGSSGVASMTINDDSPWCGNGKGAQGGGNNPVTNTMTAWAVQFTRSNAPNCLCINTFRRQLGTKEPPDTQGYNHKSFYWPTNGATSEASWNASGSLCLGAEQGTDATYAQLTNGQEANKVTGMTCFGANFGKRDPGLMVRLCRDLERNARAFPASLTV